MIVPFFIYIKLIQCHKMVARLLFWRTFIKLSLTSCLQIVRQLSRRFHSINKTDSFSWKEKSSFNRSTTLLRSFVFTCSCTSFWIFVVFLSAKFIELQPTVVKKHSVCSFLKQNNSFFSVSLSKIYSLIDIFLDIIDLQLVWQRLK